ncbi:MAG: hypothetical protein WBF08_08050 [Candidatus Bathyarchaeia archaeon]
MKNQEDKHEYLQVKKSAPYSEKRVNNFEDLALLIQAMDQDEGIRIRGDIRRFKGGGFIFITKPDDRYCLNIVDRIYDSTTNTDTVGGNDEWIYFHNFEKVWEKLKNLIRNPLEAYAY